MTEPQRPESGGRFSDAARREREARKLWREAGYDEALIARLRWNERYSIVRLGGAEFAFSRYSTYVAALALAWEANLVPGHGRSFVRGIDLPRVTTSLRGVDVDLSGIRPA